jgi:hypothetical protein
VECTRDVSSLRLAVALSMLAAKTLSRRFVSGCLRLTAAPEVVAPAPRLLAFLDGCFGNIKLVCSLENSPRDVEVSCGSSSDVQAVFLPSFGQKR